jgi:hypothetical protein
MKQTFVLLSVVAMPWALVAQTYFYEKMPGGANDVGVGGAGEVWIVGQGAAWSNTGVYRWNGSTFEAEANVSGVSISVGPDGLPWLIAADGSVFRKQSTIWQKLAGRGLDVAVGAEGSVWMVGWPGDPVAFPTLNGDIYRWSGTAWVEVGGGARRISVDATGAAWIVTGNGDVFRRATDTWVKLPGRGSDIACGPDGSVWLTGYVAGGLSDRQVYRWDGSTWVGQIGNAIRLAVAPNGLPWVVASNGDIYRLHELQAPHLAGGQVSHTAAGFQVNLPTQPGVTYSLLFKPDWTTPAWLTADSLRGDGLNRTLSDASATDPQRIYRVDAVAP